MILSVTVNPSTIILEGELDYATLGELRRALDSLPGSGVVTIDAVLLSFIDVGGYRELMGAAESLGDRGCLLLHAPRRVFRTLLDLLPVPRNVHAVPCPMHAAA